MSILFLFDASALAKRYAAEQGTDLVNRLFGQKAATALACTTLGLLEIVSVLVRKKNAGTIAQNHFHQALSELKREVIDSDRMHKVSAPDSLVYSAIPYVDRFAINATDAIVLRCALVLQNGLSTTDRLVMVSCDQRLLKASEMVGIASFNPQTQSDAELDAFFVEQKKRIREQAHANRNAQADKDELSQQICAKFVALPDYAAARTVLFYIDVRSEVRTRHYLPTALTQGKKIVVPWCNDQGKLELFHLESMEELAVGMYKILEPTPELRRLPEKVVAVEELDLIMVPGVAFDRTGARMGHGKGYYDKLLEHARPDTPLVALAFECQMFDAIPTQPHDVFMDKIITEKAVYEGKGRR